MSIFVDIEKKLGKFNLQVRFEAGDEVLSLLGASGSGKSMTLKCIAGIEKPDRGRIEVNGSTLFDSDKRINLSPQDRRTGLMFQNYALFPNMTVRQNILAGARRDKDKEGRKRKTKEFIRKFGLSEQADLLPAQVSGGQQQRTALARILISDPGILLLDEPFSALDSHLRFRMEQEVREIIRDFGRTVIMVSHNRDEVFRLSDRIAVMDNGRIDVIGDRQVVFADPKTRNACILTGCKNISPIVKIDDRHVLATDWDLTLETASDAGNAKYIGIRHHYTNGDGTRNRFVCDVTGVIENPFSYTVMLRLSDRPDAGSFGWELGKEQWQHLQSERIEIHIPPESIMLLEE